MSVANQIGLGVCMALIPYLLWSMVAAVVDRFWGSCETPVFFGPLLAQVHLNGVVSPGVGEPK